MKKIFLLVLFQLIFISLNSQEYHIKYRNQVSPIANVAEDLYISKDKIISVRDSIINFNSEHSSKAVFNESSNSIQVSSKSIPHKVIYKKKSENNKVIYNEYLGNDKYIIEDNIPPFKWQINYKSSKFIDKYTCYEARTTYRGSNIVAYFTKEIPVSSGPFKFGGLPGLILEISEEGKNYNYWKATIVEKKNNNSLDINSDNSLRVSMKEFLILEEKENEKSFLKKTSGLAKDVVIRRMKVARQGIEKKYEWENE